MTGTNLCVVLRSRPRGTIEAGHLALVEKPVPDAGPGQILIRNHYLSIEPGTAGALRGGDYLVPTIAEGQTLNGFTVGVVVQSRLEGFREGDLVRGYGGWQRYGLLTPGNGSLTDPRAIDTRHAAAPVWLGALGMSGFTAWIGTHRIARPRPGETFVVSAASGAVGASAVQYGAMAGARVVGIAGGAAKSAYVADLGARAVDYRADLPAGLDRAAPDGIDAYFDNVGGAVLDAVWPRMNRFGRIALCGQIAQYGDAAPPSGPNLFGATIRRLVIAGFMSLDPQHRDAFDEFEGVTLAAIRDGRFRHREDIVDGLERAPAAFVDLLAGRNFGKRLIRI